MNDLIRQLSEVEQLAASINESAAAQKKALAVEHANRIAQFDQQIHEESEKKLEEQKSLLKQNIEEDLHRQQEELEHLIRRMKEQYEQNHTAIAKRLLEEIAAES